MKTCVGVGLFVSLCLSGAASGGALVFPSSYNMLNGETGTFTYWDDSYNGSGNTTQSGSPLSGGLGDLTDGVVATENWNVTPGLYVGWNDITPTITFNFEQAYDFESFTLFVDDSNGFGGVSTPGSVDVRVNGVLSNVPLTDGASGAPLSFIIPLNAATDTVEITLNDGTAQWVFLSEVSFLAVPTPGAAGMLALGGLLGVRRRR
ncbi:MAG: PEP-CTERM sorting domain-containing protein [Candidatus Brocadiae bacterium]|nr:PEP-CTERM sorting domain-containing protein [Planctomycetota bacterium]NUN48068.1 PEP-CTERM sorting domain-containing protein [Candidatus Brocadiia bacterium]